MTAGSSVATTVIAKWEGAFDGEQASREGRL
jgi:Na+/H+-dicarboxylate symporter